MCSRCVSSVLVLTLTTATWLAAGGRSPDPDCSTADYQVGLLPFSDSATTVGGGDDYNLGAAGSCAGGGTQYLNTGLGDDVVYLLATDLGCTLEVGIDPAGTGDDLSLYVLSPDCTDVTGGCIRVSDAGGPGSLETVQFPATGGQDYFVIVDGYAGASGPFDLSIMEVTATGCSLINPASPEYDLGDAPDSSNHSTVAMLAYPSVNADFPTVFDPALGGVQGPRHNDPRGEAWLGHSVSLEVDADLLPDDDGLANIWPVGDDADRDHEDDGVVGPILLPHCELTQFTYVVTVAPGVSTEPWFVNVWFDYLQDGDWEDEPYCPPPASQYTSEWAVVDHVVTLGPGTHTLTTPLFLPWNPPPDGPIWMRMTLSEGPVPVMPGTSHADGRGPVAGYEIGETEDFLWPLHMFVDGFELGNTSAWSQTVP